MNSIYIKFNEPDPDLKPPKKSWRRKITEALLTSFIPVGNPSFEKEMYDVKEWLIEFESGQPYPNREIGLDVLQQPIMIMPWRRNYGYWTDNHLLLEDFKSRFNAVEISKEEFEEHWNQFKQQNENT